MKEVKVYSTNDGLGYQELAYLIKVPEGYLCIDLDVRDEDNACGYKVGKLETEKLLDLRECNYDIKNSSLYNTYLFNYFMEKEKRNH